MISDDELYSLSLKFGIWLFILILAYGFLQLNFFDTNETKAELVDEVEKKIKTEEEIDNLIKKETKKSKKQIDFIFIFLLDVKSLYDTNVLQVNTTALK